MTETRIHPDTRIGAVHLAIADLDRALAFYQNALGFALHRRTEDSATLGAGGADLLVLTAQPDARPVHGTTGLYHFAILVPSRRDLARSLQQLAETRTSVQGFADHRVSEAIYLSDPEGNGIEIYRDRPRSAWYDSQGRFHMTTDLLDLEDLLAELQDNRQPWTGLQPGTTIGHIHLRVASIPQAEAFYRDVLGFDLMARYGPAASFLSAGGYHHHIGVNTWGSLGAPPPPPDATGLRTFDIVLPNREALLATVDRVRAAGIPVEEQETGFLVRDPAHNGLQLTTPSGLHRPSLPLEEREEKI